MHKVKERQEIIFIDTGTKAETGRKRLSETSQRGSEEDHSR